jgi:hypothetical protein
MFPNIRLLIGALFASVVTLCCGFGIFAAYRVSHEPLGRLPANTAALQLVANEPAGSPAAWGTSLGAHSNARGSRVDAAIANMPTPVADRNETADTSSPWATESIKSEAATEAIAPATPLASSSPPRSSTPAARVNEPLRPRSPAVNAATPTASLAAASNGEPLEIPATTTVHETAATPKAIAPTATKVSLATVSAPAALKSAAVSLTDKPAGDASQPATEKADASPAAAIPAVASIEQPPTDLANAEPEPATPETDMLPKPRPTFPTSARKIVRKPAERRRVAIKRVVGRTATATTPFGYPNAAFHEPVFQSAPQSFQSPPATGHWTAGKATPRAATSNSTSATSGWPNVE